MYKKVKPDLVVWDARFTVPVSAEVFGVPIISVLPAYGTPYSTIRPGLLRRNPIFIRYPWLLFVIRLPQKVQDGLLDSFSKWFFYLFVRYINRIRIAYGLEPVMSMSDLAEKLQTVIMPDVEMVVPTKDLPPNFHYVGPLVWQPQMEVPEPIKDLQDVIYVSMGSTGSPDVLKLLIGACSQMREFQVVITTGELIDSTRLGSLPENLHVYKSLPGIEMAKRTRLVICHGGAGTIAQALSQGVPIIGIPFNAQQDFVMDRIVSLEAGIKLDPSELSPQKIRQTVDEVLANESYRKVAATMASKYTLERGPQRAAEIILRKLSDIRAKEEST
ncbi:MAG: glycosyltransferase [Bacteroidota bacterium]